ncbi:Putative two-component system sensor kinase [Streptomyces venezuelae]|uniref:sensor histidine kinase n=1 Tax=Streptomyces gardneri TaxID=66892 RepID=UPI0006BCB5F5|nr:histidine kinase [Streptomyces gardneri]ALO11426.1 Putative two-component system sensor kinase [Streptomyces venezuelae]QPK48338.1 two-component sensor histidine kinase [Streptomyces gardneri]WRK39803.1 histidine kinase [Streptomyces venezuelae]CUM38043.1 putative two-component system sensor kinase [Streptomyces venezuelae]
MPLALRDRPGGRLPPRTVDALVAGAVLVVVVVWTLVSMRYTSESALRAVLGWALVLIGCGALFFRRRQPVAVAVVTLLACVVYYPLSAADGPLMIAFALALYTTAAEGRFAAAVALAAVTLLAVGLGEIRQQPGHRQIDDTSLAMLAGWLISLVAVGRAQRTRLAYLHEVEQRALAAEREQEARARQSATEERLRIARELHDILGHSVSLIHVQSGAALHRLSKNPAPEAGLATAAEALEAVKSTSKDALRELRATLGVLRRADEATPTSPASGLALLGELAERARSAGLDVRTSVTGTPVPLPPPVDLAAYRIVQESLTNVTRHSGARTVRITLDWDDRSGTATRTHAGARVLRLRIADDGGGAPEGGPSGSGIRGMAERARALGGELTAGNADGGFVVDAHLPLTTPAATHTATETPEAPPTAPAPAPAPAPEEDPR